MWDTLSPSGAPRSGEATRIYELPGRLPPIIWTRAVERSDEGVRDIALRRSVVRGHLNPAARDASDGRHRQLGAERISAFEVQRDGERLVPLVDGINRSSAPGARPRQGTPRKPSLWSRIANRRRRGSRRGWPSHDRESRSPFSRLRLPSSP